MPRWVPLLIAAIGIPLPQSAFDVAITVRTNILELAGLQVGFEAGWTF